MKTVQKLLWKFPAQKKFYVLRIEIAILTVFAMLIFIFLFLNSGFSITKGFFLAALFVGLYLLISFLVQKIRPVQEHYHLTKQHLHITKKVRHKTVHQKVLLKDLKHHRTDHDFLGAYVSTKKGQRKPLFFNNHQELLQFEKFLAKHSKSKHRK